MNIKTTHTFIIGSAAFFSEMADFRAKDIDEICLISAPFFKENIMNIRKDGRDTFFMYDYGKDKLIEQCLSSDFPMAAGKFLVKEFAEHLGLTIEDLKKLKPLIDKMDEKHSYEQIIYKSYIENGDFYLTNKQRENAYEIYKKYR